MGLVCPAPACDDCLAMRTWHGLSIAWITEAGVLPFTFAAAKLLLPRGYEPWLRALLDAKILQFLSYPLLGLTSTEALDLCKGPWLIVFVPSKCFRLVSILTSAWTKLLLSIALPFIVAAQESSAAESPVSCV